MSLMRRWLGGASVLALTTGGFLTRPLAAVAAFPGGNGGFVFSDTRDDPGTPNCGQHLPCGQIYVMNTEGSGQTRLTTDIGDDEWPSWSPDGTRIAFESDRDDPKSATCGGGNEVFTCNYDIYVMNADGTGQTDLTRNRKVNDEFPTWSPDGSKIAFVSNRDDPSHGNCQQSFACKYDVYVMNADGTGVIRLTTDGINEGTMGWSPDGSKIAFVRNSGGQSDVYVMNSDGTGQTRLTPNTRLDRQPNWSPDGTQIAFWKFDAVDSIIDLYVMNPDGTRVQQLTSNPTETFSYAPTWSPDRTRIAFSKQNADGNVGIYTMRPDGTHQTLIPGTSTAYEQDWRPVAVSTLLAYPRSGPAGSAATLTGAHFEANERVQLIFTASTGNVALGKARANGYGFFSIKVVVPAGAALGKHKIKGAGMSGDRAFTTFTVT